MAVRRLKGIIAILLIMAVGGFIVICNMNTALAYVDPSASEEQAKSAQEQNNTASSDSTDTAAAKKAKKKAAESAGNSSEGNGGSNSGSSQSGSDSDNEDVVDENAFSTQGNARLGDVINDSSTKDFYTIRTENDNTFYLVIDHAGNMDNVYMLSTIDEDDLQDFLDNGGSSGTLVLPETQEQPETEPAVETPEKEPEKDRTSGIVSLVIILAAAAAGVVIFLRRRNAGEEAEEYISENMEDDGIPTVNEDDEFLE